MNDVKITIKNCPPEVAIMFEAAFKDVPKHLGREELEIPADGLTIDFDEVATDRDLERDLIGATHIFVMAHSWIMFKKLENEGK